MKKFKHEIFFLIIVAVAIMICFQTGIEAKKITGQRALFDNEGNAIADFALTSGSAAYSEAILVKDHVGNGTLLIVEDKAGGAGDVDISTQYSIDGSNWYTTYTTDMAGTISAEGNIVTALQNVTRLITYIQHVGIYMRYKFDSDADSQITAYHIFQVDY